MGGAQRPLGTHRDPQVGAGAGLWVFCSFSVAAAEELASPHCRPKRGKFFEFYLVKSLIIIFSIKINKATYFPVFFCVKPCPKRGENESSGEAKYGVGSHFIMRSTWPVHGPTGEGVVYLYTHPWKVGRL